MRLPRHISKVASLTIALLTGYVICNSQGFKPLFANETTMMLKRKLAPYVNINKKRIRIDATTQGHVPPELAEIIKTKFRTELQKDTNFIIDQNNPETILNFAVNNFDDTRERGTRTEGDAYVPYTKISGNIQVSYTAIEAISGAPVDSENLVADLRGVFPKPGTIRKM